MDLSYGIFWGILFAPVVALCVMVAYDFRKIRRLLEEAAEREKKDSF